MVPGGARRSDQKAHPSRLEQARRFLPSWSCKFDSRHPLQWHNPLSGAVSWPVIERGAAASDRGRLVISGRIILEANDEDFNRIEWRNKWIAVKELSQRLPERDDNTAAPGSVHLLVERGDIEGLRQRADTGNHYAAYELAHLLARRGDMESLRQWANINVHAAEALANLLARRGDIEGLRPRADSDDQSAVYELVELLVRWEVEDLRQLADAGDKYAAQALAEPLRRQMRPVSWAHMATSTRFRAPSFRMRLARWALTVLGVM